jgi:transcriptional regulator of acetoin/glycerol metabolism
MGAVVAVPPLRERLDDVVPLALQAARTARGRELTLTRAAEAALRSCAWPGNVAQLEQVIRQAAARTDVIDVRHLPADVLSGTTRRLSRIETFERDEIVRVLSQPGISVREAAEQLGMSRATVYRKLALYDIHLPRG